MNPPISGQYTARTLLRVQRYLLGRRGERPGDLQRSLLPEDESQLARRPQAVRVGGAESGTGICPSERTQVVLMKETVLTARLHAPVCHP